MHLNVGPPDDDPEAQKIREWRWQLQRAFIEKNGASLTEEARRLFNLRDSLVMEPSRSRNIEYLVFSKIAKVMRHIHLLEPSKVPRDAEFNFRARASVLVDRWVRHLDPYLWETAVAEKMAQIDLTGRADT
ncbi:hypothetical protein B0H17DRAFT_1196144 [Mycena rosella]|uniref:Uncharacterized protein n=1 Tax=Mycena rosella TaxID=1033263 RepID=A0AAD7DUU0_MYCRO|nr:hypothetical protein B0H17DRAFT_1196144 [Mycena rosella]